MKLILFGFHQQQTAIKFIKITKFFKVKLLVFIIIYLFSLNHLFAHSGRTNSEGCHNNRKTGGYHCHGGGSYKKKNRNTKNIIPKSNLNKSSNSYPSSSNGTKYEPNLVKDIQNHLKRLNYYDGKVNGIYGKETMLAIMLFENVKRLKITGEPTQLLLEILKISE